MYLDLRSPQLLAAVALAQDKNKFRPYLNGVYCEPDPGGGVIMVATTGFILLAACDPGGTIDKPGILPVSPALIRATRDNKKSKRLVYNDTQVNVWQCVNDASALFGEAEDIPDSLHHYVEQVQLIDNEYPDWRGVLPDTSKMPLESENIRVDGALVAKAHRAGLCANNIKNNALVFEHYKSTVLIRPNLNTGWFGVIAAAEKGDSFSMPYWARTR